jgi:[ribosomal protein S5]-alanine N-acetyltransferase
MNFESNHLIFREFVYEDWKPTFAYQNDKNFLKFYPESHRSESDVQSLITLFVNWQNQIPRKNYQLALILKSSNKLIGNAGLRKSKTKKQVSEIGLEIDPKYWGQGLATQAMKSVLEFGFKELKLEAIEGFCNPKNTAILHIASKLYMSKLEIQENYRDAQGNKNDDEMIKVIIYRDKVSS